MQSSSLRAYLLILRKRLWIILLMFAVTMTVLLIGALTAKPIYSTAMRLQVISLESEQVTLYSPVSSVSSDDVGLTSHQFVQTLTSGTIAWRTIAQLQLNTDAERLLQRLRAVRDAEFITVVVEADSPQEAENTITAQVENALAAFRTDRSRPVVVAGEFLAQQLAEAEQKLATAQADMQRFKLSHTVDSLEREVLAYQDIVRDLRKAQDNALLEETRLTARVQILDTEAEAAEAEARKAPSGSDEQVVAVRRAGDVRSTISALRGEIAGLRAQRTEYDRSIARWETELTRWIGLVDEYDRLADAVVQAQNTRNFLFNKDLEAQLKQKQALSVGYLKVIEPARRPDQPLPNRTLQIALVGGALSLVAGALLAFLMEFIESLLRGLARPAGQA